MSGFRSAPAIANNEAAKATTAVKSQDLGRAPLTTSQDIPKAASSLADRLSEEPTKPVAPQQIFTVNEDQKRLEAIKSQIDNLQNNANLNQTWADGRVIKLGHLIKEENKIGFLERAFTDSYEINELGQKQVKLEGKAFRQNARNYQSVVDAVGEIMKEYEKSNLAVMEFKKAGQSEKAEQAKAEGQLALEKIEKILKKSEGLKCWPDLSKAEEVGRALSKALAAEVEYVQTAMTVCKTVRNGAVVAAATIATGGAASFGVVGAAAVGTGTGVLTGTAASVVEQGIEVAHGRKLDEALKDVGQQAAQDAKSSFIAAVSTVTGMQIAKGASGVFNATLGNIGGRLATGATAGLGAGTTTATMTAADEYKSIKKAFNAELEKIEKQTGRKISDSEREKILEKYLESLGLEKDYFSAANVAKRMSIQSAAGMVGGTLGSGSQILSSAAKSNLSKAAIGAGEQVGNMTVGLGAGYLQNGQLRVEDFVATFGGVMAGHIAAKSSAAKTPKGDPENVVAPVNLEQVAPTQRVKKTADPKLVESLETKLAELNKKLLADEAGFDCGECADALRKICSSDLLKGDEINRLRISANKKDGSRANLILPGADTEGYVHHFAFVYKGMVYDPFLGSRPIPHNQYIDRISKVNPGSRLSIESVHRNMDTGQFDTFAKERNQRNEDRKSAALVRTN